MAKERYIDTKFWDDNYIIKLNPVEKLIFIYFLTNPITNICGIYKITSRRISFDTGVEEKRIITILKRFEHDNKIKHDSNFIIIKNFTKYQKNNPKINEGIIALLKEIPKTLVGWADIDYDRLHIGHDSLSKTINNIYFNFELRKWENINEEDIKAWEETYPACDINLCLKRMGEWLLANPEKKKTRYRRFIINWLNRQQDSGGTRSAQRGKKYTPRKYTKEQIEQIEKRKKDKNM